MKTITVRDAHTNPILSYCVHAYTKGICFNIIYSTIWLKHISLSGNLEVLSPMDIVTYAGAILVTICDIITQNNYNKSKNIECTLCMYYNFR